MKQPNVLPALLAAAVSLAPTFAVGTTAPPTKGQVTQALFGLAVPFEENKGQVDSKVAFQARTVAGPLFVTKTGELVWSLTSAANAPALTVVERCVGGQLSPAGAVPAVTRVSYLRGNDPAKWQRNVKTWQQVSLGQVWPGISVSLAARGNNAEKIFTLAPGAEVKAIVVAVEGGVLQLEANGNLRVSSADKPLVSFSTPLAWQEINGQRQPVQVAYRLADAGKYGFTLGAYDAKHAVMIDPVVQSTYVGGANGADQVNAITATSFGIYVAGTTAATDFPDTTGGYDTTSAAGDAFVARLAPDLKDILQATYFGGAGADEALAMVVTANNVYVAGKTASIDLAGVTTPAGVDVGVQTTLNGTGTGTETDAFVTMLALELTPLSEGTDLQSTYFGGTGNESAKALAVNSSAVFIAGDTTSLTTTLPSTTDGIQAANGGTTTPDDAFIAKLPLSLAGSGTQATYFGGSGVDTANAMALSSTAVYIAGSTAGGLSTTTTGAAQATYGTGASDAYVARFGHSLLATDSIKQATYLGGTGVDVANALAVSSSVYVAGRTTSTTFPFTTGGMDTTGDAGGDAFVTRLNSDLKYNSTVQQSTFLGGTGADTAKAVALTSTAIYVAGDTASIVSNVPTTGLPLVTAGAQPANAGDVDRDGDVDSNDKVDINGDGDVGDVGIDVAASSNDAFVARLGLNLKSSDAIKQTTYLGGPLADSANAIAIATDSYVYVAGKTQSIKTVEAIITATDVPAANATAATVGFPSIASGGDIDPDAANGDGFVTRFTSDLKAGLPTVETLAATNNTDLGAVLNGYVTPQGAATTVTFDLGTDTSYDIGPITTGVANGTVLAMVGKTPVAVAVTPGGNALVCGTTYHYRVVAESSMGISKGSNKTLVLPCAPDLTAIAPADNADPLLDTLGINDAVLKGTVDPKGAATLTVSFVFGDNTVTDADNTASTATTGGYDSIMAAIPGTVTGNGEVNVAATKTGLTCGTTYYFRVKAVNTSGTKKYSDEVNFITSPCDRPTVETAVASLITKNSVRLLGSVVDYGGAATTVKFQFSPTGEYNEAVPAAGTTPATPATYTEIAAVPAEVNTAGTKPIYADKTLLACYTRYHYRVKATNSVGTSYGSSLFFNTLACAPIVTTKAATSVSALQANLNAEVIANGGTFLDAGVTTLGATVKFDLSTQSGVYTSPSIDAGSVSSVLILPGTTATGIYNVTTTLTSGIACGKTYYYRAKATNKVGTITATTVGNQMSFVTPACAPVVITLPPTNIETNAALLRGTVEPKGLSTTVAFDFGSSLTYGTTVAVTNPGSTIAATNAGSVLPFQTLPPVSVSGTASGLDCGGAYNYRVTATNTSTIKGANQLLTTKACAPVATNTVQTNVTANGATLNGTVDPNGANTQVFFEIGLTPQSGEPAYAPPAAATPATAVGTKALAVSLAKTGLTCDTDYSYRVKAINSVEGVVNTDYSSRQTFTTSACNPVVSTDFAATRLVQNVGSTHSTNAATLYGTVTYNGSTGFTPRFDYGPTTAYTNVNVTATAGTEYVVNGVTKIPVTATITGGLTCGNKIYHFRLKAVKSPVVIPGLDKTFTTLPCTDVPSVITTDADTIKKDRADLNGAVKSNGSGTTVSFDFGNTTNYGTRVPATTPVNGTISGGTTAEQPVAATRLGLTCGVTYHYRVRAVNSDGTTLGANKSFTTVCPPVVTTGNPNNIKQITATINGTVNAKNSDKNSDSTVTFHVAKAAGANCVVGDLPTIAADGTSPASLLATTPSTVSGTANTSVLLDLTSTNLTDLTAANCGSTFCYRLKAENNVDNQGTGTTNTVHGAIKSFKTVCAPVASASITKQRTIVTSDPSGFDIAVNRLVTATLNGKVDTGLNGAVTNNVSFDFGTNTNYGTKIVATPATVAADTDENDTASDADGDSTPVTAEVPNLAFPNLPCGVMYHYRTRAVNAGNVDIAADQVGADKAINAICPAGATTKNATGIITNKDDGVEATLNGVVTSTNKQAVANGEPATPDTLATFLFDTASHNTPDGSGDGNGDYPTEITPTTGDSIDGDIDGDVKHDLTDPDITCGKNYYYRLKLVNSGAAVHGGGTTYGEEKSFRTAPCTHTAVTAAASDITDTTATLNGVVNTKGAGDVTPSFEYGTTTAYGTAPDGTAPDDVTVDVDTPVSQEITTGLEACTEYHYRVKGETANGTVEGADVTFKTTGASGAACSQTINFGANPGPIRIGATGRVTATSTSGLAVTFATTTASKCSVGATTAVTTTTGQYESRAIVTGKEAGSCVITASHPGNTYYAAAAATPPQTISITSRSNQTITGFTATPSSLSALNATSTLAATGGASGNPVTFSTSTAATICTLSGSTVTAKGNGSCIIKANQAGNASYNPAPQVTTTIAISGI